MSNICQNCIHWEESQDYPGWGECKSKVRPAQTDPDNDEDNQFVKANYGCVNHTNLELTKKS